MLKSINTNIKTPAIVPLNLNKTLFWEVSEEGLKTAKRVAVIQYPYWRLKNFIRKKDTESKRANLKA